MKNRESEDDKMSRKVWQTVEASTRKIRVRETERRGSKGRSREEKERKGQEEEIEKGEDDGSKEGSREMRDME